MQNLKSEENEAWKDVSEKASRDSFELKAAIGSYMDMKLSI